MPGNTFLEIVIIAICTVIFGADGWSDVELFGRNKKEWPKTFLELPKRIPSHNTFGRVFAKIKPDEFQKRFIERVQVIEKLTAGQVIAAMEAIGELPLMNRDTYAQALSVGRLGESSNE